MFEDTACAQETLGIKELAASAMIMLAVQFIYPTPRSLKPKLCVIPQTKWGLDPYARPFTHVPTRIPIKLKLSRYGSFRKLGLTHMGVLTIRILLFRVLYSGPLFSETLISESLILFQPLVVYCAKKCHGCLPSFYNKGHVLHSPTSQATLMHNGDYIGTCKTMPTLGQAAVVIRCHRPRCRCTPVPFSLSLSLSISGVASGGSSTRQK